MFIWRYEQSSGRFFVWSQHAEHGVEVGRGYAGHEAGRNNPAKQNLKNVGPLPRGWYTLAEPSKHPRLGPLAFHLTPDAANEMFGRSAFFIHGDNKAGDASRGCIILPRSAREIVAASFVRRLWVTF